MTLSDMYIIMKTKTLNNLVSPVPCGNQRVKFMFLNCLDFSEIFVSLNFKEPTWSILNNEKVKAC